MPVDSGLVQIIARQNEKKQEDRDPFNIIMKGLNVANQVYGIKSAADKMELMKLSNQQAQTQKAFENKAELAGKGLMLDPSGNIIEDTNSSFYKQRTKKAEPDPYALELKKMQIETAKNKIEQSKKEKITPGQKSADAAFSKDYIEWNTGGGISGVEKQLSQLEGAAKELESDSSLTGPGKGLASSLGIRSVTNPKAVEIKQQVENAINSSLRATLGSAFTEKEGQRIFNQSYDENLPPEANIRKIKATAENLRKMAAAKEDASRYFEENGTLAGFNPATERSVKKETSISSSSDNPQDLAAKVLLKRQGLKSAIPKGK